MQEPNENTATPSPDMGADAPLSEAAQRGVEIAEARAAEKRDKHAADDASLRQAVSAGGHVRPTVQLEPNAMERHLLGEGQTLNPALLLQPDGELIESRDQALSAATAMVQEQIDKQEKRVRRKTDDLMWYVRCHYCHGPGIWIFKLSSDLKPDDWASSYKPRGVMWPSRRVPCQCCLALRGTERFLKIWHTSRNDRLVSMGPAPRMVHEITISEFNRLMESGAQKPADAAAV